MTAELAMQSVPRNIFSGMNQTEIPNLQVAETFETVETVADSSEEAKASTHKQNILKRLVSRKKKGSNTSKKNSRGRSMMGRISRRIRSKSVKKVEPKKLGGAVTVASEEAPTSERESITETVVETTTTKAPVVEQSEVVQEEQSETHQEDTPEVEESVEVTHEVQEAVDTQEEVPIETESEDSESSVDTETYQEEVVEETLVEKADFHQTSSDYVGLALVGILVGLLASPMLHA